MDPHKKGLAIIFHSGSYERIYHGLSIALAGLALGREVKFFFTYWALEYLRKDKPSLFKLDAEAEKQRGVLEKNIERGHIQKIDELIIQTKSMKAKIYACTNSMGLLNISRGELIKEVDKSMGITTFLTETSQDQILFIWAGARFHLKCLMKEIKVNGQKVKIISTVDAVGLFCPIPVVKLKLEMEKVELNQVIELLADDPGILEDLPAWCRETNQRFLSIKKNQEGIFVAYVQKN